MTGASQAPLAFVARLRLMLDRNILSLMPENQIPKEAQSSGVRFKTSGGDITVRRDLAGRDIYYVTIYGSQPFQPRRSELPQRPPLFGREYELAEIADALAPESRTWGVLIDGPVGIGKTTLALEAGHRASNDFFPTKIFLSAKLRKLTPQGEQSLKDFALSSYENMLYALGHTPSLTLLIIPILPDIVQQAHRIL